MIETLSWVAMCFTLFGLYLVGQKNPYGFFVGLVSNVFWLGVAAGMQTWALAVTNAAIGILNIRGWILWTKPTTAEQSDRTHAYCLERNLASRLGLWR